MGECPRELDMEPIIAPIKTGDTGAIVANLQDALLALLEQKKILQPLNEESKGPGSRFFIGSN